MGVAGAEMKEGSAGVGTKEQEGHLSIANRACMQKDFAPFDETTLH